MGITYVELEVANVAQPEKSQRLEFLVDSGAVYSVVPAAVLRRLGKRELRELPLMLA